MPVSVWLGMEDTLQEIVGCEPKSVLDAGIGFGLFGHLLRQYLDVWEGRVYREDWRVRIDGIEIEEKRVQPHARHLYDSVLIGDIRSLVPEHAAKVSYDVILFGDVLVHLPKEDAAQLIREASALASRRVIIRIPLGTGWHREGGEEADLHRSTWDVSDFAECVCSIRRYEYYGNPYAVVSIDTSMDRARRLARVDRRLREIEQRMQRLLRSAAERR